MTVILNPAQFHPVARELTQGIRVDRATDTLPQTASEAIFTITGGRVLVIGLIGEVTTAIGAGVTPDLKIVYNPTAAGTSFDLCTAVSVASDAVGQTYTLAGDVATPGALVVAGAVGQANPVFAKPLLLSEGDIEINMDESVAGSVSWSLIYVPWDAGAEVAAAAL